MFCSSDVKFVCLCLITLVSSRLSNTSETAVTQNVTNHLNTISALTLSNMSESGNSPIQSLKDQTHKGREHVTEASSPNPIVSFENTTKAVTSRNYPTELNVIDSSRTSNTDISKLNLDKKTITNNTNIVNSPIISISTFPNQKSKPTTVKAAPTKPMRTEHDELNYLIESKQAESHTQKISNINTYEQNRNRRADYVVPIVAVILSVPLVAIIISVLYKRGTDWWQHRNYRRMDFLIEGMYNN